MTLAQLIDGLDLDRVRLPKTRPNLPAPVNWEVVDPLLRAMGDPAALKALSRCIGVSLSSLGQRRRALCLPPLPRGRPKQLELTLRERDVKQGLEAGMSKQQLAAQLGVTRQAVEQSAAKAAAKGQVVRCRRCDGLGLVTCNTCHRNRPHFHMCPRCNGHTSFSGVPDVEEGPFNGAP